MENRLIDELLRFVGILCISLYLSACNGGGGSSTDVGQSAEARANASVDGDVAILDAVYRNQRVPVGFYTETATGGSYTISHVKNVELMQMADRIGKPVYELSTDDFTEALNWSEEAAQKQLTYRQLVDVSETDLYIEFRRIDPDSPDWPHLSRVFKKSVLDRANVDRNNPDAYQGMITLDSPTAQQVKKIIEYLWRFSFSNNNGTAVLHSDAEALGSEFVHTMVEARLSRDFDGGCDTIDVYEVRYTVLRSNGTIWKHETLTQTLSTTFDGYTYSTCNDS